MQAVQDAVRGMPCAKARDDRKQEPAEPMLR